jgi:hypothetical protein
VLLLPFTHHDVSSPYRAAGPIFVRRGVKTATPAGCSRGVRNACPRLREPRTGLPLCWSGAELIERLLQMSSRRRGIGQLVEAEQPDAERSEVRRLVVAW